MGPTQISWHGQTNYLDMEDLPMIWWTCSVVNKESLTWLYPSLKVENTVDNPGKGTSNLSNVAIGLNWFNLGDLFVIGNDQEEVVLIKQLISHMEIVIVEGENNCFIRFDD